jgi:hypothetical protein
VLLLSIPRSKSFCINAVSVAHRGTRAGRPDVLPCRAILGPWVDAGSPRPTTWREGQKACAAQPRFPKRASRKTC